MKKLLSIIAICIFTIGAMAQPEIRNGFYYSPQGFKVYVGNANNSRIYHRDFDYSGLYSADGRTLIKASEGFSNNGIWYFCVINGTEAIGSYAFSNFCRSGDEDSYRRIVIYIPSSVKYIAPDAFNSLNEDVIVEIAGIYDDCINITESHAPTMSSPQEKEEIARYNIQGMKVDEDTEGVQIIQYNNGTSKKVLKR